MTSRALRGAGFIIAGCVLVSSCYVATHYEGWQYDGGAIVNNGLFSRPRFEAPLPSVPFNTPGHYEFTFSHFPAEDALVMFSTPDAPSIASIEQLGTELRVRIIDQNNEVRCDAAGSPRERGSRQMVVTSSAGVIGLWHGDCTELRLRDCAPCRAVISLGPIDPATPAVRLTPTLRGGGFELP